MLQVHFLEKVNELVAKLDTVTASFTQQWADHLFRKCNYPKGEGKATLVYKKYSLATSSKALGISSEGSV